MPHPRASPGPGSERFLLQCRRLLRADRGTQRSRVHTNVAEEGHTVASLQRRSPGEVHTATRSIPPVYDKESPLHTESPLPSQEAQGSHGGHRPAQVHPASWGDGFAPCAALLRGAIGLGSPDHSVPSRGGKCAGCLLGAAVPNTTPTRQSHLGLQNLLSFEPSALPHRVERTGEWEDTPPKIILSTNFGVS